MRSRSYLTVFAGVLVLTLVAFTAPRVLATSASPVADAAQRADTDAVRTLLRDGADVNAAQGDGMSALHWAALNGDLKTMDVLLYAGATTESLTRVGNYTPLHLASSRGHGAVVARLLEAGSKPGPVTATGVQPVHLAAQAGSAEALKALIDRGANINAQDETHGRTPLIFAASQNRLEAMKFLIAKGADKNLATKVIDYRQRSAADGQSRQARDRMVSAATGRATNSNINLNDPPPAGQAAGAAGAAGRAGGPGGRGAGGRGAGAQPIDPNDPALQFGRGGRGGGGVPGGPRPASDIEQIGRQGGFSALHYAMRDGYTDAAVLLLDAGMNVNLPTEGDRSTPMAVAAINGQYDLVMALLERGGNPNLTNDDGVAPLFAVLNNEWALRTWYPQPTAGAQQKLSYLQLMEALLKGGADPNARTMSHIWYAAYNTGRMGVEFTGATPFWRAAYALDVEAMRLLVKYGADPSIATMSYGAARRPNDLSGMPAVPPGGPNVPPLHAASGVGYGTSRVAQQHRHVPDGWMPAAKYFLEELGVDINIRDGEGFTALHHAAARGDNEMIMYLVKRGADVMAVNRAGQTTVDMANSPEQRTQPFPETIKLLEGMGAKNNHNCRACK
ncbi:MAG TPA: ankyrin repeat domain-containing protein [Vicinamibacterales bacterium]|nr:ankyrin repeat domain-containing protein [Vicinamibacterales bacterium]